MARGGDEPAKISCYTSDMLIDISAALGNDIPHTLPMRDAHPSSTAANPQIGGFTSGVSGVILPTYIGK